VATPDAWPWKDCATSDTQPASRYGISDVEFIRSLLDVLVDKLCVDRNRIYATGGSNGGLMSTTLGRTSAEGKLGLHKIAASAPVAAIPVPLEWVLPSSKLMSESGGEQSFRVYVPPSPSSILDLCHPSAGGTPREPVPIHVFFAKEDRLIANGACYGTYSRAVSDMTPAGRTQIRSFLCKCYKPDGHLDCPENPGIQGNVDSLVVIARCMVNRWARENGCSRDNLLTPPVGTGNSGWGVPVGNVTWQCDSVPGSRGDTILTIYDTPGGADHPNDVEYPSGHIWPGGVGDPSEFKVTDAIWDFFEKHPR
jgi:poly(3-hydroxybutyrate) depolymerase